MFQFGALLLLSSLGMYVHMHANPLPEDNDSFAYSAAAPWVFDAILICAVLVWAHLEANQRMFGQL